VSGIEDMIHEAEKWLGTGEPNGIQRWYCSKNPDICGNFAWCDAAVTYWAWHSGNQASVTFGGYYAYTVAHAEAFRKRELWHTDVAGIRRGDIVFFDWNGSNSISRIDHVGIVTGTGKGGAVHTIEGNTDNVCARRVRYAKTITGYGRPQYSGKPKPQPGYEPFPGAEWFKSKPNSPIVTAMGRRLVANGCSAYQEGPGPQWSDADRASYAKWQKKLGYTGSDADGWPGKTSWDKLKVPNV